MVDEGEPKDEKKPKRDYAAEYARRKAREQGKASSSRSSGSGGSKRGRKSKAAEEEETAAFISAQVSMMLIAGFGFMGAKLDPLWNITTEEAESIAEPAGKILARMGGSELAEKYGDWVSLAVAGAIVVMPRLMMYTAKKGAKKPYAVPDRNTGRNQKRPPKASAGTAASRTEPAAPHSHNVKNIVAQLTAESY